MTDIFSRYPEVRDKPAEMAMLCPLLRARGLHDDALALGAAAVAAAPLSNEVRGGVVGALSSGVANFHLSMLQDHARNRAYARAIERMVRPGMRVLEIGTGAGLLAMIAARAGAEVVTCEENPMIAAVAAEIIARNGLSDRIRLVRKRSTEMTIPEDLSEPADLVIHEIFGSTLFDEGVTAALTDARRRLLKPGAPSVPPRARVRCVPVRMNRPGRAVSLARVEGFDLSPFELLCKPSKSVPKASIDKVTRVTDAVAALTMDYDLAGPFGPASETIVVPSRGGRIDGYLQWIGFDFGDGDWLENDPFADGPESSWGVPYTALVKPIETRQGEPVHIRLRHRGTLLVAEIGTQPAA